MCGVTPFKPGRRLFTYIRVMIQLGQPSINICFKIRSDEGFSYLCRHTNTQTTLVLLQYLHNTTTVLHSNNTLFRQTMGHQFVLQFLLVAGVVAAVTAFQAGHHYHHRPRGAGRVTTSLTLSSSSSSSSTTFSRPRPASSRSSSTGGSMGSDTQRHSTATTRLYAAAKKKAKDDDVETYRKKDLVAIVAEETGLSKADTDLAVSTFLDSIVEVRTYVRTCLCVCVCVRARV